MDTMKVKKFVKKHKKELVIGGAGLVIGCVLTKRKINKTEIQALKAMRSFGEDQNGTFGSLANCVLRSSNGARCVNTFVAIDDKNKLTDYVGYLNDYYKDYSPEVTGMLVFTK